MCGCGRKAPTEVITSHEAAAAEAARQEIDLANQQISAANAVANAGASSGWFAVAEAAENELV